MKRAVTSKKTIAMLVATAALAGSSIAGASHSALGSTSSKPYHLCPPAC